MPTPKTINITVSATTDVPHPPTLNDGTNTSSTEPGDQAFTTEVSPGDHVQFLIGGNITEFTTISETVGNLFSRNPSAANGFNGIIKASAQNPNSEYTIFYKVAATPPGDNPYSQDPKLQMKN